MTKRKHHGTFLDAYNARARLRARHGLTFSAQAFAALLRQSFAPPPRLTKHPSPDIFFQAELDAWARDAARFVTRWQAAKRKR